MTATYSHIIEKNECVRVYIYIYTYIEREKDTKGKMFNNW